MENSNLPTTTNNQEVTTSEVMEQPTDNTMQIMINCVKTDSRQDKIALLNALDSADIKLVDMIGQEINIKGVYAETHYSHKKQAPVCRVLIIDTEGKSYATGSFIFMNSLKNIIDVLGAPTDSEPLKIKVVEQTMEKGNAIKAKVVE